MTDSIGIKILKHKTKLISQIKPHKSHLNNTNKYCISPTNMKH